MINSPKPLSPTQFCVPLHSANGPNPKLNHTVAWGWDCWWWWAWVLFWFFSEIDESAQVVGSGLL